MLDTDEVIISDEYQEVLDLIKAGNAFTLISGKAGTGKSTFIKYFQKNFRNVITLAPTGIAALNIGGQTIHSFCRLPLHPIQKKDIREVQDKNVYRAMQYLIIDEISMVRADILDGINWFLQKNRNNQDEPFGGVRVLAFGDLFQIPPVVASEDTRKFLQDRYEHFYFFGADVYNDSDPKFVEFTKIYRQKDKLFITALNFLREGQKLKETLAFLNKKCVSRELNDENVITLTTINQKAHEINAKKMAEIDSPPETFEAKIIGDFDTKEENLPAPRELTIKVGAQVMFCKNDMAGRWVNGTLGKVVDFNVTDQYICVEVEDGDKTFIHVVAPEEWARGRFGYDRTKNETKYEPTGKFIQFPLKLAWAVTIHKCQGQTFNSAVIDLARGAFVSGQVYVAMSRCRTLEGISLTTPIYEKDVIIDPILISFNDAMKEMMQVYKENNTNF